MRIPAIFAIETLTDSMIAKIVKGASFKGCVLYVTGKVNVTVLASDGVLLGSVSKIADSSAK